MSANGYRAWTDRKSVMGMELEGNFALMPVPGEDEKDDVGLEGQLSIGPSPEAIHVRGKTHLRIDYRPGASGLAIDVFDAHYNEAHIGSIKVARAGLRIVGEDGSYVFLALEPLGLRTIDNMGTPDQPIQHIAYSGGVHGETGVRMMDGRLRLSLSGSMDVLVGKDINSAKVFKLESRGYSLEGDASLWIALPDLGSGKPYIKGELEYEADHFQAAQDSPVDPGQEKVFRIVTGKVSAGFRF